MGQDTSRMELTPESTLDWLTAFCIFEIPLALFFLSIASENDTVTDWYSGKTINIWNVIAQDFLYVLCGIIITYHCFFQKNIDFSRQNALVYNSENSRVSQTDSRQTVVTRI